MPGGESNAVVSAIGEVDSVALLVELLLSAGYRIFRVAPGTY